MDIQFNQCQSTRTKVCLLMLSVKRSNALF